MGTYFRIQETGITFDDMKNYVSEDGGDGMLEYGGICACDSVTELLNNTVWDAFEDGWEIVIFKGYELCEIYDGYRVEPVKEITRITFEEFDEEVLREYEEW